MTIIIESDTVRLARRGATLISEIAVRGVASRGRFAMSLSGGSSPRPMHRVLGREPYRSEIPWEKIHIFWADERCVPETAPESNYGAALKDFLDCVPIPRDQVHPMPTVSRPEEGARVYENELHRFFRTQPPGIPVFDLICLGIGDDGHTASLFPGNPALGEKERLVVSVRGGDPDVNRLTMTFPLLNHAGEIIFLVSGKQKASILKEILEGPPGRFPAQSIKPIHGRLTWLLDLESASLLQADRRTSGLQTDPFC